MVQLLSSFKMHQVINKTIENRSNESLPRQENEAPLTFQIHSEKWRNGILLELELLQKERILCTLGDIRTLQTNQQGLHQFHQISAGNCPIFAVLVLPSNHPRNGMVHLHLLFGTIWASTHSPVVS